jgi:hydroxymethylpyrimidine/phosphomethylpyrimidine kinase
MLKNISKALTIAGSDSGGCAGIQADLKTFGAFGVHGMSVITAVTAQNTLGVTAIQRMSPAIVDAQLEAVFSDIGAQAVKTGMIAGAALVKTIAVSLKKYRVKRLVVDPVMVATSGARLMPRGTQGPLCRHLMPLALVVTPNRQEAEILTGQPIENMAAMREAARRILDFGPRYVYLKGGHLQGPAVDLIYDGRTFCELYAERVRTRNLHGSGCTLAAALCAGLANGLSVEEAADQAKKYVTQALRNSLTIGHGPGPLGHFFAFWDQTKRR